MNPRRVALHWRCRYAVLLGGIASCARCWLHIPLPLEMATSVWMRLAFCHTAQHADCWSHPACPAPQTMLDDLGKGLVRAGPGAAHACSAVCMLESSSQQAEVLLVAQDPVALPPPPSSPHCSPPTLSAPQGPVFVAFFIERLGRTGAFNLSTLGWVPCGLLLLGTGALAGVPGMAWDASQGSLVRTVGDGCCTTLRATMAGEQLNGGTCCCPCANFLTPWLALQPARWPEMNPPCSTA